MAEKISKVNVWKLKIDEKVERETIETALSDACREVMQKGYLEGSYGVIERVDIRGKETIVFISGNQRTAKIFSDTLATGVPRKKITFSKVSQSDVMKFT